MRRLFAVFLAFAGALSVMAGKLPEVVSLPVEQVVEIEDFQLRNYPGKIVAVAQVQLTARVSGEILELGFRNGDIVKKGQLLFLLDSVKYKAAVKNAEAKIEEYKARTAYAESNYKRNLQLSQSKAVSQDTLENALSGRNVNQASLAAAEADLESAKDDLAHCRIVAPIAGKIGTANFTEGNYVTTSSGTLATLVQASPIRVRFSISSRDFLAMFGGKSRNIQTNGIVKLILANGDVFPESGAVEYIDNTANDNTDTIQVFALFPNAERILKPGGTVGVTLQSKVGIKKSAVAPSAVMQDVKGAFVWRVDDQNIVHKQYIVRGSVKGDFQLVESGLDRNMRVVADGVHKVSDGERIMPVTKAR